MKFYTSALPFFIVLLVLLFSTKGISLPTIERVEEQIAALKGETTQESEQNLETLRSLRSTLSSIAIETDLIQSLEKLLSKDSKFQKIDQTRLTNPVNQVNIGDLNGTEIINLSDEVRLRITLADGLKTGLIQKINDAEGSINDLPQELANLNNQATPSANEPTEKSNPSAISNQLALAKQQLSELKLKKLRLSVEYSKLALPHLKNELEKLNKALSELNTAQKNLTQAIASIKSSEAQKVLEFTQSLIPQLQNSSDALTFAKANIQTAKSAIESNTPKSLAKLEKLINSCEESLNSIIQQSNNAKERLRLLEKAGMPVDRTTGELLRKQRANLLSASQLRKHLNSALQQNTEQQIALLEHKQQLALYPNDPNAWATEYRSKYPDNQISSKDLEKLASIGKSSLQQMIQDQESLAYQQGTHISLLERTITASASYSSFLDKKLLWIASHAPLSISEVTNEFTSAVNLLQHTNTLTWFHNIRNDTINFWFFWVITGILLLSLIALRRKFLSSLKTLDAEAQNRHCSSITPTSLAIFLEGFLTAPIPILLYFIAWRSYPDPTYQAGFIAAANFATFALTLNRFARKEGLLHKHFRLPESICIAIQKNTKYLLPVALPAYITANILIRSDLQHYAAGRILFSIFLVLISLSFHLLWKAFRTSMPTEKNFSSHAFYFITTVVPLLIVLTAIIGYYTSAITLLTSYIQTLRIGIIIIMFYLILQRWLIISRRRIALKSAQEAYNSEVSEDLTISRKEFIKQELEGITEGSEQSRRLLRASAATILALSLLAIWSNTFPALNALDDVPIWRTTAVAEPTNNNNLPTPHTIALAPSPTEEIIESKFNGIAETEKNYISLQDILISIIVLILTYFCSTNIPGLLRLTILDRLNLQTGAAFGLTTIVRYTLITIGIILAFSSIGVTWGKVQWLAAAITLGIGFGLQEIFANFVSGLIILFERPIRIGDMVTVGNINGRVHKIQMRSTTILQFNNRELIVPNKEFITTQLVNWTLTTNIMRTKVCVGIAYGSDTELVTELLLKCSKENKRVLKEPSSDVIFDAFGASSLDFELRVFVNSVDDLVPVQSELHYAIDSAFRAANIEIAFPQQDLYIKGIPDSSSTQKHGELIPNNQIISE